MKIDGGIGFSPSGIADAAREVEALGYDGAWAAETGHDPFLPLAIAAEATERIELGTAIAVAFARNPMNLAMVANDLQLISKGRFILGLGPRSSPTSPSGSPWSGRVRPRGCARCCLPSEPSGTAGRTGPSSTSEGSSTPTPS